MDIDSSIDDLLHDFIAHSAENGDLTDLTNQLSVGFVVDDDDPLQQGRIKVFCPAYNDDPKKLLHLPWCAYVSPFGGAVNNNEYVRGHMQGNEKSNGPVHYGFWAIPEIGAHVLVGCINGDPRRRYFLGCFPSHQETHTIGNGRFKHEGDKVEGPLTSTGNPIEPTYTKLHEAFNQETGSAEWKTRGADYQVTSVTEPPSPDKQVYVDDDYETISRNETDDWVKEKLGEHGYDWTSYKNIGSFLSSKVYTFTTPGFHSITLDDRPYNARIRIRTAGGAQMLLDDTNERIYVSPGGGESWVEMDANGNVDMYSKRRVSVHAEKDINLTAGESIRMKAGKYISMYAGDTRGQTPLTEAVPDGDIRIHSSNDTHIRTEGTMRMLVDGDLLGKVTGNTDLDFTGNLNIEVDADVYIESLANIHLDSPNIDFRVSGKDTTVNNLIDFLDEFVEDVNDFRTVYNGHSHGGGNPPTPTYTPAVPEINDEGLPANPVPSPDETQIAPWTNRVPDHEPWPRVIMQDSDDTVNSQNSGYINNVDWVEQYDNTTTPDGREPIGQVEGDEELDRGMFWRR